MLRPGSSPASGRKGRMLPRIAGPPSASETPPVAHERFWHAAIDVGVGSTQGYRPYHEDEFQVVAFLAPNQLAAAAMEPDSNDPFETHFFAVFDGHAGGRCSKAVAATLADTIARDPAFYTKLPMAIQRGFHRANDMWFKLTEKQRFNDGTTAVCALVRANKLYTANVGDSRAILLREGKAIQLTNDHKPMKLEEQRRIASFGGSIVNCMGIPRVNGVLAVSRAFGNRQLRDVIRADPEIAERAIGAGDDFIVLGSDGLYDVLSNQEICSMCYELQNSPAQVIADHLVATALHRGSMDNITAVVVDLRRYIARRARNVLSARSSVDACDARSTTTYPPLVLPKADTGASMARGALASTVAGPPRLGPKSYRAKFEKTAMVGQQTLPSSFGPPPQAPGAHLGQSAVVAGGSTQRPFSLRPMLPGQQFLVRPKTGALRRSGDASVPLTASNGQHRPASSPNSLLKKKQQTRKGQQNTQELSPFLHRSV